MSSKIDGRLSQQLIDAEKSDGKLQAWFRLTPKGVDIPNAPPEQIEALAQVTLNRAKKQAGEDPENVTIQPYLGIFTVYARPKLVRFLLKQPEIVQAGATHIPEFGLIRPVESKPVVFRPTFAKQKRQVK